MKPETIFVLSFVGVYFVGWLTVLSLLTLTEVACRVCSESPAATKEALVSGLRHVRRLVSVFCLLVGVPACIILGFNGVHPIWSILPGALVAFGVHLLSLRLR